jgi:RimJ/RimL family protein N-acetyltransferase
MYYKKIEGDRIYLSPMNQNDIELFLKWMNDSEITDRIGATRKMYNEVNEKAWLDHALSNGEYAFTIVDKKKNTPIGNCSFMEIDPIDRCGTVGIFIGEETYRNNGYGTETLRILVNYGFKHLNLHNINLWVYSFNERAIACYKKVGFKEIGRRHECYYLDGKYYDRIMMEVLDRDFNI